MEWPPYTIFWRSSNYLSLWSACSQNMMLWDYYRRRSLKDIIYYNNPHTSDDFKIISTQHQQFLGKNSKQLLVIRIMTSPVKTQQFILLFTCFGLKGHHQLSTKLKEYIYIYTVLYGIEISKPHNFFCYVGIHNMGRIALGNTIYITVYS
jgi:hypothetical protein